MSKPIVLNESGIVPNAGIGRYCELRQEIKISEAVEAVKKLTSLNFLNLALARNATLGDLRVFILYLIDYFFNFYSDAYIFFKFQCQDCF